MSVSKVKRFDPRRAALPSGVRVLCARSESEDAWLREREMLRCTGSRVGSKLGISPFSEQDLDDAPDDDARRRMEVGSMLEGVILSDPEVRKGLLGEYSPWRGGGGGGRWFGMRTTGF